MMPSKFSSRPAVHPAGQTESAEIWACGKATFAARPAPVDGCGEPPPALRFKGFAEGRRLRDRLVLGLAGLLDHGARALRHLAKRWDHRGDDVARDIDRDPLGRFLDEAVHLVGNHHFGPLDGLVGKFRIERGEAGGEVPERAHHHVQRPLHGDDLALRQVFHRAYSAWLKSQHETGSRQPLQATEAGS